MMIFQSWGDALTFSLMNVWNGVANFVPTLILAIVIFAIGWILAMLVEKIVEGLFKTLKIDNALRSAGFEDVVKRAGYNLNSGLFVGVLVKWFVIVVFLMASFDILKLSQVNLFLNQVVSYLPQVIVAVLMLLVTAIVANAMKNVVIASTKAGHVHTSGLLGSITKWSIWVFGLLAALLNMNIAPSIIQMLFTALFGGLALAFGLAFGLGGKDVASRLLDKAYHSLFD